MKRLYGLAWLILAAAVLASVVSGSLDPVMLVALSLAALSLVYGLALWSVIVNTRDARLE